MKLTIVLLILSIVLIFLVINIINIYNKKIVLNKLGKNNKELLELCDKKFIESYELLCRSSLLLFKDITPELNVFLDKIEASISYVSNIIHKYNIQEIDVQEFLINILYKYKNLYNITIEFNFRTKHEKIKIDKNLIKDVIYTLFGVIIKDNFGRNIIIINVSDTILDQVSYIKISFLFSFIFVTNEKLFLSFDTVNEINFSKINRSIFLHYGRIDINIVNSKNTKCTLILPILS